jgi:hypothetical protein
MTVSELIKELQALPPDMKVQVLDSDKGDPEDIVQVSRGSWGGPIDDDEDLDLDSMMNGEFIQDDENGQIAVLVIW